MDIIHYLNLGKRMKKSEQKVLNSFDHVVTVSKTLTDELTEKYPNSNSKFHTINNGFDKDDILKHVHQIKEDKKIRLVFLGTLYDNAEKYFNIYKLIRTIKSVDNELSNKIEINFYGILISKNNIRKCIF